MVVDVCGGCVCFDSVHKDVPITVSIWKKEDNFLTFGSILSFHMGSRYSTQVISIAYEPSFQPTPISFLTL